MSFLLACMLSQYSFPCPPNTLEGRVPLDVNMDISLVSDDFPEQDLQIAAAGWNDCGETPLITTDITGIIIFVEVDPRPGVSLFDPEGRFGQLRGGTIKIRTHYETVCCGIQERSYQEMIDSIRHELGHVLGVDHSGCPGAIMGPGQIQPDGSIGPRSITESDCGVARSMWFPEANQNCDPTDACLRKRKAVGLPCCDNHSPLVIDLNGDGFRFTGLNQTVKFDLYGFGPIEMTWTAPGSWDAFLFRDINGDGLCNDGSELFGHGTIIAATGERAADGFEALAQFDDPGLGGNSDGMITEDDDVWGELMLWCDRNADAASRHQETYPVSQTPFTRFTTRPAVSGQVDRHGNRLRYWGAVYADGMTPGNNRYDMVDVFFISP